MSGVQRFRKRPIAIDAMQWDGTFDSYLRLARWCGNCVEWRGAQTHVSGTRPDGTEVTTKLEEPLPNRVKLFVAANNAWLRIEPHEWIIRDPKGFYPCKPDIFEQTYEAVEVSA